jgi:hypothetical protein
VVEESKWEQKVKEEIGESGGVLISGVEVSDRL